jgi:hypothetical protein
MNIVEVFYSTDIIATCAGKTADVVVDELKELLIDQDNCTKIFQHPYNNQESEMIIVVKIGIDFGFFQDHIKEVRRWVNCINKKCIDSAEYFSSDINFRIIFYPIVSD